MYTHVMFSYAQAGIAHMKNEKGFTLVELAIVLMIIGLLIGGVLRGQEMMDIARMQRTMKDAQSYMGAIANFQNQYGTKPGDIRNAQARLPGCTTTANCYNGNGDGYIGTPQNFWDQASNVITAENVQFWKHLALSKMITGINPQSGTVSFGTTHPTTAVGGGFTVITSTGVSSATAISGTLPYGTIVLRVHGGITGNVELNPTVSPSQAGYIDRKMDDGKPQTGYIRTKSYGNNAAVANCEEVYTSETQALCTISFVVSM